jgi:hypothetical protein
MLLLQGASSGGSTGDYLIETKANFLVKYAMSKISTNLSLNRQENSKYKTRSKKI